MIRIAANSFAFSHHRLNSANHVVSDSIATIGFIVPGADHVARFDFSTGHFLDFCFQLKRLNGQSIEFVVD